MIALAGGGFGLASVAARHRGEPLWDFIGYEFGHVPWQGCALWDLILPCFLFMVGVAVPYSYAARKSRGDSDGRILSHALWRSFLLVLLGLFLAAQDPRRPHWILTNVLTVIGVGYSVVFLLRGRSRGVRFGALAVLLVVPTVLFAAYPVPGPGFDYAAVGVDETFPRFTGFAAHWNKNTNFGHAADFWLLNLLLPQGFKFNEGGYQTIAYVPAIGSMLIGLLTGEFLRTDKVASQKIKTLALAGVACLGAGAVLDPAILPGVESAWSIVPVVKRVGTLSFVLWSSGWALLFLAALYWVVDFKGYRRWTFPLVVVGMNSIAMYMMSSLMRPWITSQLRLFGGRDLLAGPYGPIFTSVGALLVMWLICFWMYRRKIFLRL
jgi:predicted acyltransferase